MIPAIVVLKGLIIKNKSSCCYYILRSSLRYFKIMFWGLLNGSRAVRFNIFSKNDFHFHP